MINIEIVNRFAEIGTNVKESIENRNFRYNPHGRRDIKIVLIWLNFGRIDITL